MSGVAWSVLLVYGHSLDISRQRARKLKYNFFNHSSDSKG